MTAGDTNLVNSRPATCTREFLDKAVARKIRIHACALRKARGVVDDDLESWTAQFGNPTIFVSLVDNADRILTE